MERSVLSSKSSWAPRWIRDFAESRILSKKRLSFVKVKIRGVGKHCNTKLPLDLVAGRPKEGRREYGCFINGFHQGNQVGGE